MSEEKESTKLLERASPSSKVADELFGESKELKLLLDTLALTPIRIAIKFLSAMQFLLEEERKRLLDEVKNEQRV